MSSNAPTPALSDSTNAKRKQTIITVGIAIIVFGGIILGLYLTDPKRNLPDSEEVAASQSEALERFKLPGNEVDPREVWISRGEADISALK